MSPLLFSLLFVCLSACGPDVDTPLDDGAALAPASAPAGYYDSARGKTGAALLKALSARVQGQRALGYTPARDTLFGAISDPDNDDVVECVYTGRRAAHVRDTQSATAVQMNTEHVWPQSLGAAGIAKTDLHHLYAVDDDTNGRRGNYPFGAVQAVTWTAPNPDGADASRLGRAADGRTVFEPQDRAKGNIARAILYFYTRYSGEPQSGFTLSNFQVEKAVLRRWHDQDPPDADERARNDLVFSAQGNRNPYIDRPEFVQALGDLP